MSFTRAAKYPYAWTPESKAFLRRHEGEEIVKRETAGASSHTHGVCAHYRNAFENNVYSRLLEGNVLKDVGGNINRHLSHGRKNVHVCNPITCAEDLVRYHGTWNDNEWGQFAAVTDVPGKTVGREVRVMWVDLPEGGKTGYKPASVTVCQQRYQVCDVHYDKLMFNNSMYYISQDDFVAELLPNKTGYAAHHVYEKPGVYMAGEMTVTGTTWGWNVAVNGNTHPYTHPECWMRNDGVIGYDGFVVVIKLHRVVDSFRIFSFRKGKVAIEGTLPEAMTMDPTINPPPVVQPRSFVMETMLKRHLGTHITVASFNQLVRDASREAVAAGTDIGDPVVFLTELIEYMAQGVDKMEASIGSRIETYNSRLSCLASSAGIVKNFLGITSWREGRDNCVRSATVSLNKVFDKIIVQNARNLVGASKYGSTRAIKAIEDITKSATVAAREEGITSLVPAVRERLEQFQNATPDEAIDLVENTVDNVAPISFVEQYRLLGCVYSTWLSRKEASRVYRNRFSLVPQLPPEIAASDRFSELRSIATRMTPDHVEVTREALVKLNTAAMEIRRIMGTVVVSPMDWNEWIERYPRTVRKKLEEARYAIRVDRKCSLFTKKELAKPDSDPRAINPRGFSHRAKVGPWLAALSARAIETLSYMTRSLEPSERDARMETLRLRGTIYVDLDFSRFDMRLTADVLEATEHAIYAKMLPKEIADELRHQLRGNKIQSAHGFTFQRDGMRYSGDMNTSLGNGFVVGSVLLYAGVPLDAFLSDGDDVVIAFKDAIELAAFSPQRIAELGMKIKPHLVEDWCHLSFCSKTWWDSLRGFRRSPARILKRFGWRLDGPQIVDLPYIRQQLLEASGMPVVTPILEAVLSEVSGSVVPPIIITDAARQEYFEKYGAQTSEQIQIEDGTNPHQLGQHVIRIEEDEEEEDLQGARYFQEQWESAVKLHGDTGGRRFNSFNDLNWTSLNLKPWADWPQSTGCSSGPPRDIQLVVGCDRNVQADSGKFVDGTRVVCTDTRHTGKPRTRRGIRKKVTSRH